MYQLCRPAFVRPVALAVSIALIVSGCATASKDIAPAYVSPLQYRDYDCAQLAAEAQRIQARVVQLGGRLDQAAQNDAGIMAIGIVLFWPVLFALGGTKQQEAEFARLKGEYDAVEQAAIEKKCDYIVPSKQLPTQQAATQSRASEPQMTPTSQPAPAATSAAPASVASSKYQFSAERFSKDAGCIGPVATMNLQTPTYETFTITCSGGEPRSIRCEDNVCRELK